MKVARSSPPALRMAIDYGPLLVFFLVNFFAPSEVCRALVSQFTGSLDNLARLEALLVARIIVATSLFAVATVVALVFSKIKLGHISPMLAISATLVLIFGGLTIYFQDPKFIQIRPTIVYSILAAALGFGLWTGRPLLEGLLGMAYPGLSAAGWNRLTLNWAMFFVVLAVGNEIARAVFTFDTWVLVKFPGFTIVTIAFAAANIPMLLRNGLALDEGEATAGQLPPE